MSDDKRREIMIGELWAENSQFSEFIRNASAERKEEVYSRVIEQACSDQYDMVNHPSHYGVWPDKEAIDIIRKVLTREEYIGYLKGNSLKYRLRIGAKDIPSQDLKKAQKYEEWLGNEY